jgi:GNAT superfamily N-acetyltransferase
VDNIRVVNNINLSISNNDLINRIIAIDSIIYPKEMQGTFDSVMDRFCANTDSFLLLLKYDIIIGYLCLFPIKDDEYFIINNSNKIFDDAELTGKHIIKYCPGKKHHLLLISMGIIPKYQRKGCSHLLSNAFREFIKRKEREKIIIDTIDSYAVTVQGEHFLINNDFNEIYRTKEFVHFEWRRKIG